MYTFCIQPSRTDISQTPEPNTTMGNCKSTATTETNPESDNDLFLKVESLNKRTLGKFMIRICGNEGVDDNEENGVVRRQIQTVITHLEKEKATVWDNAEVKLYDGFGRICIIQSGEGKYKFLVLYNGENEVNVVNVNANKMCMIS